MDDVIKRAVSRDVRLVLLTAAAGAADAIGYLSFGHIFIANMTGNVVLLGLAIGLAQWPSVPRYGLALLGFVLGATVGARIVGHTTKRDDWPIEVSLALLIDGCALAALAIASTLLTTPYVGPGAFAFIALGALAMGVQTTGVCRLQVAGLSTTVITSTIASVIETAVARLNPPPVTLPAHPSSGLGEQSQPTHVGIQIAVVVAYGLSAAGVALLKRHLVAGALWLPAGLVLLAVLLSRRRAATHQHPGEPTGGEG